MRAVTDSTAGDAPADNTPAIDGFRAETFTFASRARTIYTGGDGPAVIVMAEMPGITLIGGDGNDMREGVVSLVSDKMDPVALAAFLRERGIRTHTRKADHYSGNILTPLGLPSCLRISICHYNTLAEVARLLTAMEEAVAS